MEAWIKEAVQDVIRVTTEAMRDMRIEYGGPDHANIGGQTVRLDFDKVNKK